ncbi:hypothetical protein ACQKWADRAFT_285072 [Trichoderma austrokoningii]
MEAGLVPVPGFPCLQVLRKGKPIWHDEAWEQRYYYLVHQRRELIMERLARLLKLPRYAQEDFFGRRPAPPRLTLQQHSKGRYTRSMRCEWWQSVDNLLKAAAERSDMDEAVVKARFWAADDGDDDASDLEAQAKEWDGVTKEENSNDSRTAEDVFNPRDFAANWASDAWQHVQD